MLNEGHPMIEVIKELQITDATWYRWINHYGSEKNAEVSKRTKELGKENARLKKLLAQIFHLGSDAHHDPMYRTTGGRFSTLPTTRAPNHRRGVPGLCRAKCLSNHREDAKALPLNLPESAQQMSPSDRSPVLSLT